MGLEHAIEKLDKYFKRLEKGKARKIKPDHVAKVLHKLEARERELQSDLETTEKTEKKSRLAKKLELVREQQARARWLQDKISDA